jgi:hypothetical protein
MLHDIVVTPFVQVHAIVSINADRMSVVVLMESHRRSSCPGHAPGRPPVD